MQNGDNAARQGVGSGHFPSGKTPVQKHYIALISEIYLTLCVIHGN